MNQTVLGASLIKACVVSSLRTTSTLSSQARPRPLLQRRPTGSPHTPVLRVLG